ncbi:hypothetical protein DAMNIGENAA_38920 [Desulforhabdus amnigena]|uniref:Uncharacterized protein n=1 Tax=Desulforhabdus amnigena TaxID=40218 RepID=A0A9W6FX54_9BACT|nr:hypothetical protein DAMNIGENAA_38920 [Desulforhabdus amnigena]
MNKLGAHLIAHGQKIETVQQGTCLRYCLRRLCGIPETRGIAYFAAFRILYEIEKIRWIESLGDIAVPHLITADNYSIEFVCGGLQFLLGAAATRCG